MKTPGIFHYILMAFAVQSCSNGEDRTMLTSGSDAHYSGSVEIIPENSSLNAELDITYKLNPSDTDSLSFLLYSGLEIDTLIGKGITGFNFYKKNLTEFRFTDSAGTLVLYVANSVKKGETINFSLSYSGSMGDKNANATNKIEPDWIEIGSYKAWYPYKPVPVIINFTHDLEVQLPMDYSLTALGSVTKTDSGRWNVKQTIPTSDMVLISAPDFEEISKNKSGYTVQIYKSDQVNAEDSVLTLIAENGTDLLTRYTEWFGEAPIRKSKIVIAPRKQGSSYSRLGLIVTVNASEDYLSGNFFHLEAHEFAHLWWNKAPVTTWEDWLNESFAEYSALLAEEYKHGGDRYDAIIDYYLSQSDALPALWRINRSHQKSYSVMYRKGPVILHRIREKISDDNRFFAYLENIHRQEVNNTEQLLELTSRMFDPQMAEFLENKLKE